MQEEVIMRLVKSNESESGCKTKLTNTLTNKTNVEQNVKINVNNFCGERKKEKKGEISHSFLYVETMGVNGADTLDPHLFSAETDRFSAVSKRLNALQDHVRNGVIR